MAHPSAQYRERMRNKHTDDMNFAIHKNSPACFREFAVTCQEIPSSCLMSTESIAPDAQCSNHKSEEVDKRDHEEDADNFSKSLFFYGVSNHKNQLTPLRAASANAPSRPALPASGDGTMKLLSLSADSGVSI